MKCLDCHILKSFDKELKESKNRIQHLESLLIKGVTMSKITPEEFIAKLHPGRKVTCAYLKVSKKGIKSFSDVSIVELYPDAKAIKFRGKIAWGGYHEILMSAKDFLSNNFDTVVNTLIGK